MAFTEEQIEQLNQQFKGISPTEIISWAVKKAKNAIVTTNFRPYEIAILHAVSEVENGIPVVWCDTVALTYNYQKSYFI